MDWNNYYKEQINKSRNQPLNEDDFVVLSQVRASSQRTMDSRSPLDWNGLW